MKRHLIWMLGLALAAPAAAQTCPSWQQLDPASWTCAQSGEGEAASVKVVSDADEWSTFWASATGQRKAPVVDFGRELVVVKTTESGAFRAEKVVLGTPRADYWQAVLAQQAGRSGAA